MNTKLCTRCSQTKDIDQFRLRDRRHKGKGIYRENICSDCRLLQARGNCDKDLNQDYIWNILSNSKCELCGEDNPIVLEFDHLRDKVADINKLLVTAPLSILRNEIIKCRILCANCHRIVTAKQLNSYRYRRYYSNGGCSRT